MVTEPNVILRNLQEGRINEQKAIVNSVSIVVSH
jgi:hypothetical protein